MIDILVLHAKASFVRGVFVQKYEGFRLIKERCWALIISRGKEAEGWVMLSGIGPLWPAVMIGSSASQASTVKIAWRTEVERYRWITVSHEYLNISRLTEKPVGDRKRKRQNSKKGKHKRKNEGKLFSIEGYGEFNKLVAR
ncbi:hypothetical protein OROHE_015760 [Orobanche hederae]